MKNPNNSDNSSDHSKPIPVKVTQLISLQKAAAQLDVSVDFIRKQIKAGKLETFRIGRSVDVTQSSLDAFISKSFKKSV